MANRNDAVIIEKLAKVLGLDYNLEKIATWWNSRNSKITTEVEKIAKFQWPWVSGAGKEVAKGIEEVPKTFINPLNIKKGLGTGIDRYVLGGAREELAGAAENQGLDTAKIFKKRDKIEAGGKKSKDLVLEPHERKFINAYNTAESKIKRTRIGVGAAVGTGALGMMAYRNQPGQSQDVTGYQ